MYVHPFVVGVVATLLAEIVIIVLVVVGLIYKAEKQFSKK